MKSFWYFKTRTVAFKYLHLYKKSSTFEEIWPGINNIFWTILRASQDVKWVCDFNTKLGQKGLSAFYLRRSTLVILIQAGAYQSMDLICQSYRMKWLSRKLMTQYYRIVPAHIQKLGTLCKKVQSALYSERSQRNFLAKCAECVENLMNFDKNVEERWTRFQLLC